MRSGTHTFLETTRVHFGADALEKLEKEARSYDRAFVITGRSLNEKTSLISRVEAMLGGRHAGTFAGIGQHTPGGTVERAAVEAETAAADLLVSVGGGSVIDGTKAVARELGYPQQVAIPTTLSGAEWANRAGVTDERSGRKRGFADPKTVPRVVVLDPEATVFTPEKLWLSTSNIGDGMVASEEKAFDRVIQGPYACREPELLRREEGSLRIEYNDPRNGLRVGKTSLPTGSLVRDPCPVGPLSAREGGRDRHLLRIS